MRLNIAPNFSDRVHHLFRRFAPYHTFPGPAVGFIRELCERHARTERGRPLTAEDAVHHFIRRTGLPGWLLRDEEPLEGERLLAALRARVIGQEEAVRAAARVVTTLKAGLNDPQRPLGVLLFLGPTGVGKTELARALAAVLFGNRSPTDSLPPQLATHNSRPEDRLVRLDMSEYSGPDAVERLLGPPHGEPGALVRRLRQQPFCVLLLDEIEKAATEVFDALMGVCDEGRLTDRYGRTTTFRSCLILMTSNLGAEQREAFGFGDRPPPYAEAARTFFRPEFYNRLDAVVTFEPLRPETIRAITLKELAEVQQREGLERCGLRLRWSERLVAWLGREGFDARLGARPLQRVLERRVAAPLACYLLTHPTLADTELLIDWEESGEVRVCRPDDREAR